jgi:cytoskeletal protein RodZ|tara:strand:+ start:807 stop:1298 length:492 start_codon:yes stop_codon:yes gene_type:complete
MKLTMVGFKPQRLIVLLIILVGLGVLFRLSSQASQDQPAPVEAHADEALEPSTARQFQASLDAANAALSNSNNATTAPKPVAPAPPQASATTVATPSAAQRAAIETLPLESQIEIRAFASRDNNDLVVEQVSPTLFRASLLGIHQTVPVATIGADGQVTIDEY